MSGPVLTTNLPGFPRHQGKVRDIYDLGDHLLLVASDRMSAFDVVMNEPIPDKGRILTTLSAFWFRHLADVVPNHVVSLSVADFPPALHPYQEMLAGRTMLVRKCRPLPVECIVRGYLSGSGWAEYKQTGAIGGLKLPPGLVESQQLPEPVFTPSTKAELGVHDENISFDRMTATLGADLAAQVREISLTLYRRALAWAEPRGIIIAD
ncbi:MAG: phosphoribosylaminoimidazolesuccinocarboxamide synthase, partial [Desulfobaccales bacterium]